MTSLVWIASYPRSGNTWVRLLLDGLRGGDAAAQLARPAITTTAAASRHWFDETLLIESSDLTRDEAFAARPAVWRDCDRWSRGGTWFIKAHDAWTRNAAGEPLFPPELTAGAIYVVRDPRDVACSWAAFLGIDIDAAIAVMAGAAKPHSSVLRSLAIPVPQRMASWSENARSWLDSGIRLHAVAYEAMLADPDRAAADMVRFLGWETAPETMTEVVAATRFDRLRRLEAQQGFCERPESTERFFRRGQAGGWRDTLSAAQVAGIERDHGPMMRRLGYL